MSSRSCIAGENYDDALLAAALLAIGGAALGGIALAGLPGTARDAWIAALAAANADMGTPLQLSPNIGRDQFEGGLDIGLTLATGQRSRQGGLLERLGRRAIVLKSAGQWSSGAVGQLLTTCEKRCSDGRSTMPVLIAFDESLGDDVPPPSLLQDRLALRLFLDGLREEELVPTMNWVRRVKAAQIRFGSVSVPDEVIGALVAVGAEVGIVSSRADMHAVAVARAHAAWRGVEVADETDVAAAARLVFAHRSRQVLDERGSDQSSGQESSREDANSPPPSGNQRPQDVDQSHDDNPAPDAPLEERLVAAARAALPPGLLETSRGDPARAATNPLAGGRARGARRKSHHGRPIGTLRGDPRHDGPLDLMATIAAAAPWQAVRQRLLLQRAQRKSCDREFRRLIVLSSDIRVRRFHNHAPATTVFAVDASGSSALHRMAEAKGAIELLLAECYVRREKVAVIAFRGTRADVLLPPTRALARARRALTGLPGGGATPLASGIEMSHALALSARRAGEATLIVLLTDGRANIDREGHADRRRAGVDAMDSARRLAADRVSALLIDTSPAPGPKAADLARAMNAHYVPLPHAGAREIAGIVGRISATSS